MKRLFVLFIAAFAVCLSACEQHKADKLSSEYQQSGEKKVTSPEPK